MLFYTISASLWLSDCSVGMWVSVDTRVIVFLRSTLPTIALFATVLGPNEAYGTYAGTLYSARRPLLVRPVPHHLCKVVTPVQSTRDFV